MSLATAARRLDAINRATDRCRQIGLPVTREGVATIARYLDEERSRNCQSDRLVGGNECVPVHAPEMTHVAA